MTTGAGDTSQSGSSDKQIKDLSELIQGELEKQRDEISKLKKSIDEKMTPVFLGDAICEALGVCSQQLLKPEDRPKVIERIAVGVGIERESRRTENCIERGLIVTARVFLIAGVLVAVAAAAGCWCFSASLAVLDRYLFVGSALLGVGAFLLGVGLPVFHLRALALRNERLTATFSNFELSVWAQLAKIHETLDKLANKTP